MTNEEAINVLNDYDINFERNTPEEVAEAHEMAIEALKTQPCNDCISREATLTAFSDYVGGGMSMNDFDAMWDIVVKMPPVEPKPKTSDDCISRKGYWIEHKHGGIEHIECSKCRCWFLRSHLIRNTYCPNCGSYNGGTK